MSKAAYVLGVGPGLGAAVARKFAREGYAVALMARKRGSLEPVVKDVVALGVGHAAIEVDATKAASVSDGFEKAKAHVGEPHVVVYNAGAFKMGGILDVTPEEFEECWRANCAGAFFAAQAALPSMLARGNGTLLFTSATAAMRGSAKFSCLAVGKFGLRALAQSIAREHGASGVHVAHVIIDGQIDTPRVRGMMPNRAPDSMLSPEAIADTYWHLHQQPVTAWTLELDLRPAIEKF
jgi:NAD(P)-dependent dehydrogenase (short-subunit alcohol dehydrogenase family)